MSERIDNEIEHIDLDLTALQNDITSILSNIGNYQGQTNLKSILQALGIPDVAGKSLHTLLISDRLDNATYGLNALKLLIDAVQASIVDPSADLTAILEETEIIETHLHSYGRWFEKAVTPSGESHVADRIGTGAGSFQIDAGNNDWGAWVQVLGSNDTPVIVGKTYFDWQRISIEASERTTTYFLQFAVGASPAAALLSNDYDEVPYIPAATTGRAVPVDIRMARKQAGTKGWVRCKAPGQNTATVNFYIGLHEY